MSDVEDRVRAAAIDIRETLADELPGIIEYMTVMQRSWTPNDEFHARKLGALLTVAQWWLNGVELAARPSLSVLRDVAMQHGRWTHDARHAFCHACGQSLAPYDDLDQQPIFAALDAHQLAMMEAANDQV